MKKAGLSLALAVVLALAGCTGGQRDPSSGASHVKLASSVPDTSASSQIASQPGAFTYTKEALSLVNGTLEDYAAGTLPEPVRYNSDYNGISNVPPVDSTLPEQVSQSDVQYDRRYGDVKEIVVATLELENGYTMDIHMETESGTGKPLRVIGVSYYDMLGTGGADHAYATRGGEFLHLKSDRLFASADFRDVRTDAGLVSGSMSWGKANRFVWIDIDSMREPFFYTYFVTEGGGLIQDYPQKDWQAYDVVNDERMMLIAQSLFDQFCTALGSADLLV